MSQTIIQEALRFTSNQSRMKLDFYAMYKREARKYHGIHEERQQPFWTSEVAENSFPGKLPISQPLPVDRVFGNAKKILAHRVQAINLHDHFHRPTAGQVVGRTHPSAVSYTHKGLISPSIPEHGERALPVLDTSSRHYRPETTGSAIRLAGSNRWFGDGVDVEATFDFNASTFKACFDPYKSLYPGTNHLAYLCGSANLRINASVRL
ncbi:hypothetical protein BJ322DRAFT_1021892 [Thelephora terrestris]|uniref:Uncharacterized protein n=1 Tax=Thelephora terrestris TaxID=56493 RepID=A0A9P6HBG9_9AGAM|nr:hypothetical protein BJ322DRAFT_1021892 [Thelephora terrestris]